MNILLLYIGLFLRKRSTPLPPLRDNASTVGGVVLDPAPSAIVTSEHGAAAAGVIAVVDNSIGGVGVAFGASITGVNIFGGSGDINGTDVTGYGEAIGQAWTLDIINNSWGAPPDFNNEPTPPTKVANRQRALSKLSPPSGLAMLRGRDQPCLRHPELRDPARGRHGAATPPPAA